MKKNILLLIICFGFMLAGCDTNKIDVDKRMVFFHQTNYDGELFTDLITVDYDSETMQAGTMALEKKYEYIKKENIRSFAAQLTDRGSSIEELDGVEIYLNVGVNNILYKEDWNYNEVIIEDLLASDPEQSNYVEEGHVSAQKIQDYYVGLGYSCDIQNIEE